MADPAPYTRVASRLCISHRVFVAQDTTAVLNATGASDTLDHDTYRLCRVDLRKAAEVYGGGTAFGKAVAWVGQMLSEGENVMVCGEQARAIALTHLQIAGFSEEEARGIA